MIDLLKEAQLTREQGANDAGTRRLLEAAETRKYDEGPAAKRLARFFQKALPAIKDLQKQARKGYVNTPGPKDGWRPLVPILGPEVLTYVTLRSLLLVTSTRQLSSSSDTFPGCVTTRAASQVGYNVYLQARYEDLAAQEYEARDCHGYDRLRFLERQYKAVTARKARDWLRELGYESQLAGDWSQKHRIQLGAALTKALLSVPGTPFEEGITNSRGKTVRYIRVTDDWEKDIQEAYRLAGILSPVHRPMIIQPVPWHVSKGQFAGGFCTEGVGDFHVGHRSGSVACPSDPGPETTSEVVVRSINNIQATAWSVNDKVRNVVDLVQGNWEKYVDLLGVEPLREPPARLNDETWQLLTKEEKRAHARRIAKIHEHNYAQRSRRNNIIRANAAASEDRLKARLYFPHGIDWRERAYPLPQDFHPQGGDICRGMLLFQQGVPLGTHGYEWLVFHTANTYGNDKVSRQEQVDWFYDNEEEVYRVADDPLGKGYDMLREAAEPWQFLAVAKELRDIARGHDNYEKFLSRIPVMIDGTCNGLQHMSAMGRDPEGAFATNLTSCEERQDIYDIVAKKVRAAVAIDAERCADERWFDHPSSYWYHRVDRSVVKRGVMTLPYGLTRIGMRDQLLHDGWTDDPKAARYLADLMQTAIEETVTSAALIMEWLQFNAAALAGKRPDGPNQDGVSFTWTSPSGSRVTQAYHRDDRKQIRTVLGSLLMQSQNPKNEIRLQKQALGIVPNLIHNFDAAHMHHTVNLFCASERRAVAAVHDSYGTHAGHMYDLLDCTRQTFYEMYQTDWMAEIQADFEAQAPKGVELRSPPPMGDWDPKDVLSSQFFFC